MRSVADLVNSEFRFLLSDYGFALSDSSEEDSEWVVVLSLDSLRLRLIEDRANLFADVSFADDPSAWYELSSVLLELEKLKRIPDGVRVKNNPASLRSIFSKYMSVLIGSLGEEEFRRSIRKGRAI